MELENNVNTAAQPIEAEPTNQMDEVVADVRADILSLFDTFPYISSTMIQVGIGPSKPPKLWRPVLEQLVKDGILLERMISVTTPKNRNITRTVYHPMTMPWPPVSNECTASMVSAARVEGREQAT